MWKNLLLAIEEVEKAREDRDSSSLTIPWLFGVAAIMKQ